jgi:hypothetical protein
MTVSLFARLDDHTIEVATARRVYTIRLGETYAPVRESPNGHARVIAFALDLDPPRLEVVRGERRTAPTLGSFLANYDVPARRATRETDVSRRSIRLVDKEACRAIRREAFAAGTPPEVTLLNMVEIGLNAIKGARGARPAR